MNNNVNNNKIHTMSSYLDDCEWQRWLDENFTATVTTNLTSTSISDGLLLLPPPAVRSVSYGSENHVSPAVAATATAAATAAATTTIKSEPTVMLDDENNIDDEAGTCSRQSYSYSNFADDFDSSDDEAIIYPMKTAAKKNSPPSLEGTTSSDGNDLVSASTTVNDDSTFPNDIAKMKRQRSAGTKRKRNKKNPANTECSSKTPTIKWESKFQQLVDFKDKFRHTNVPQKYAENKPLARWVMAQRSHYKLFKANKKTFITRARVQSLDELGFKWEVQASRIAWEERRQHLVVFKNKYLHTNVPRDYEINKPLANWVMHQRKQYKLFKANKKSYMTRERIQCLDELDFEWEVQASPRTWEERRQQLADFKDKFLHTKVSRVCAETKPLAAWVSNQRTQYKLFKAYKKSIMTRERIQSLDELGFEWLPKLRPSSSSLVETSPLVLSTQDGYESDTSELSLII